MAQAEKATVEGIKAASNGLRGSIATELADGAEGVSNDASKLLKFHGTYLQDDRDLRKPRRQQGLGKKFIFMVRNRIPGGKITAAQFLSELDVADEFGNGTIRITTRQGIQLHGVVKADLWKTIRRINEIKLSTQSACGDVERNVVCCPAPLRQNGIRDQLQLLADRIADHLRPRTRAYHEIWLEDPDTGDRERVVGPPQGPEDEPIYGVTYLPRKVAERYSRKSSVPIAPLFLKGSNVAEAVADAGRSSDLVVMAARRRGAMGRLLCGSVVTQLLHHTALPLLIAPGYNFPVERAIPKSIRRILIPLDGSEESEAILDVAAELSSLTAAERTLIRVVRRLPYAGTPWNEKEDEALSYLNQVAVKLRRHPSAVRTEIVSSDEAVGEVILANAQASDIDLIAVTSRRGRGLADRFVRGPASYLIGKAHRPILVIRATPRKATRDAIGVEREMQQFVEAEAKMTRILDGQ